MNKIAPLLCLVSCLVSTLTGQTKYPDDYENVEGAYINLGATQSSHATAVSGVEGFYLNTQDSTVLHFNGATGAEVHYRTPWLPVACGIWNNGSGVRYLVIISQGTHSIALLNTATGNIDAIANVGHEPRDLVIDQSTNRAFIACGGDDIVQEYILNATGPPSHVTDYPINSKHPVSLDLRSDGKVLVSTLISGNDTKADNRGLFTAKEAVISGVGLPDEDIFLIDPIFQTVTPLITGVGTANTCVRIAPNGDIWVIGLQSDNANPARQSEALLNGRFATNSLSIYDGTTLALKQRTDLDEVVGSPNTYTPGTSGSYPWDMVFLNDGSALIACTASDSLVKVGGAGLKQSRTPLIRGTLPRDLALDTTGTLLSVICEGTTEVQFFNVVSGLPVYALSLDLGHDPTPDLVLQGKKLFFNSDFSANGRFTCAHCHLEGGADLLAWNLSDKPTDDKGPMVTQTLRGIHRTGQFHWRGERPELSDFQVAFTGLLGSPQPMTPQEFEAFEAYVFSLRNPANPFQREDRQIDNSMTVIPDGTTLIGKPVDGETVFNTKGFVLGNTCRDCHILPVGTNHDIQGTDVESLLPRRTQMKAAPFHELWRKIQPQVTLTNNNRAPLLGSGFSHAGLLRDLFRFHGPFPLTDQERADLTAFLTQVDQGLGKVVHRGYRLATGSPDNASINNFLMVEAMPATGRPNPNCDVVMFGTVDINGSLFSSSWFYDRAQNLFVSEQAGTSRALTYFLNASHVAQNNADLIVLGVPVGMGERFGVDFDADGLFNGDEAPNGTNIYQADFDADGFPDGYEVQHGTNPLNISAPYPPDTTAPSILNPRVQWLTSHAGRVTFHTDEPCRATVIARTTGHSLSFSTDTFEKTHDLILNGLFSSLPAGDRVYAIAVEATDHSGNRSTFNFSTSPVVNNQNKTQLQAQIDQTIIDDLKIAGWYADHANNNLIVTLQSKVTLKWNYFQGPRVPAANQVVIYRVFVDSGSGHTLHSNWSYQVAPGNPTSFLVNGAAYGTPPSQLAGPFVITQPTIGDGLSVETISIQGLNPGDRVRINVEAVVPVDATYNPAAPDFGTATILSPLAIWDFATTKKENRGLERTF
ncbi:MAG: hypothetical protein QNK37_15525 [Acidobacteriota bacterium]|nr:hypothetical protein [Acidobacteriota bacterium]